MKILHQIISWTLLAVLFWSITPLESFHQHEEHTLICIDSNTHIEGKIFECELSNFVLPTFTKSQNSFYYNVLFQLEKLVVEKAASPFVLWVENTTNRGPPEAFKTV